ncbi:MULTISPECIES: ribbon-helix-helix protein, CopG family [unclassified Allokutzneria]|uniref:ribbon-helix-helix protein, CopG family n=1 Tax=unclassified Allokutzneria TaxID=2649458 RepID=UPI001AEF83F9|nr:MULTISPECIES: ribbon-helix-helix protein, CopG family [unclassified Allokutzneria]MCP3799451.1 ribbon-helix-helix protein, CopG family [Allokutzneria sp. A3M-2-11 16]
MAMTLRLTDEETEALRLAAERERRSMQDIARRAIREYVNRRNATRDAALARIVTEDAELLKRLAQ